MDKLTIDLSGKIAVVTGATGQLGRTMARTLAACGADVAVHYHRNQAKAEELRDEIAASGRRSLAVAADVSDKASVEAMRDAVGAGLGVAHIIVNNAVSKYDWKPVLEQAPEDYEGQFRTSVLHNVLMAQAFVPGMIAGGEGGTRHRHQHGMRDAELSVSQSAYVSGKRGMDGVLRIPRQGSRCASDHGQSSGSRLDDQRPTIERISREEQPGYSAPVPMKRRGTDQEIANVVAFLASDLASFVSGVYLPVCGGNVMPAI